VDTHSCATRRPRARFENLRISQKGDPEKDVDRMNRMDRMQNRDTPFRVLSLTILFILFILSTLPSYRIGSSRAFCTVRNAKLEWTRATPGSRVRCLLCKRSKSAVSATTTRTT